MRKIAIIVAVLALASCSSDSSSSDTTAATDSTATTDTVVDTTTAPTDSVPSATSSWKVVPSAKMPSTTQDVPYQEGMESKVPTDGQYWGFMSIIHGSSTPAAVATLVKLYAGEACYEYAEQTFQAPEDMCTNDYGVVDYPRALATLANDAYVSVITEYGSESWPTESYEISASDLQKFVNDEPVEGKPSKYDYVPYPYLLTITDGKVTRAEQVWVP
jgi:hypothetical protein